MRRRFVGLVILWTSATALLRGAPDAPDLSAASASMLRVQDSLQSLLVSLDNSGKSAKALSLDRQTSCDSASKLFKQEAAVARLHLSHLHSFAKEREAAVHESEGIVQQLEAEVALAQHTVNLTSAALAAMVNDTGLQALKKSMALRQLLESREQMLVSLQGELVSSLLPAKAQLGIDVAEAKRRLEDRVRSVKAIGAFAHVIRKACAGIAQRSKKQALARVGQAAHINTALQSIEHLGLSASSTTFDATQDASVDVDANPEPPSFLQLRGSKEHNVKAAIHRNSPNHRRPPSLASALLQRLDEIQKGQSPSARTAWCVKERARNEMELQMSKEEVKRAAAEIEDHSQSEAELGGTLAELKSTIQSIGDLANKTSEGVQSELKLVATGEKNSILAVKILQQAVAILKNLESSGSFNAASQRSQMASAAEALSLAILSFKGDINASPINQNSTVLVQVAETYQEAAHALGRERESLEQDQDSHATRRLEVQRRKAQQETENEEAEMFLKKLAADCGPAAFEDQNQRKEVELQALRDARDVLNGQHLVAQRSPVDAAADPAAEVAKRKLSPIERAAFEMGVSTD